PPVYDWSSAIAGMALAPFFGGNVADATWTFFIISPAFWGALTIFPVYFLGKEIFSKKAGLMAALLMGIMASHIERCPAGFADHDAMVLFFVVATIFFLVKALGALKEKKWIEKWHKPRDIVNGIDDFFKQNKIAVGYSVMSGLSIATVALIWKGFPYIFVIILGYFTVQLLFNHIKKTDSLGVFICVFITIATSLIVSFPYYAYFTTGTWMSPLYLLLAMIFVGIFLVPTRDQPWLIVIPVLISSIAVIMSALSYFAPEIASSLFSGGGYFIRSKLYDTIAEAQAPDMSRLTISYGPVTFYLALIGLVIAAIDIPKKWKPNYMLIILWCGLAIYMAMSAVRFMFNATPVFAILGGWVTWRIIEWVDPSLRTFKRPETKFIYLYVGILTLVLMIATYWRYYIELEDFELFQLILGLALIGIFSSLMAIYFMAKYNIYIGAVIFIAFLAVWLAFSWHDDIEVFLFGLIIVALILVPILIFTFLSNKISGFRVELKHIGISLFIILLVLTPNMWFAVDSAIPYESKSDFDPDSEILGAFGHSFPSEYWQAGEEWLSEQDNELPAEDRPAFISWWDYGFWTTYLGKHPTVADNFQAGYQLAGSFIAAQNESEAISLFAARLLEGDYTRNKFEFSQGVKDIIIK
ncbi:MAG: glycosyltransferase family 39 protein, partial [Thermoplasmata archaeon]|nr:glycosyltransferase family 39 protein [Thermoplasmata archaeon]